MPRDQNEHLEKPKRNIDSEIHGCLWRCCVSFRWSLKFARLFAAFGIIRFMVVAEFHGNLPYICPAFQNPRVAPIVVRERGEANEGRGDVKRERGEEGDRRR